MDNYESKSASEEKILLRVENLSQHFGSLKAVDNVSFNIKKGEVFGLVGESGCGKTTTGRSIIKLYNITSGNVYFEGRRIGAGTLSYKQAIAAKKKETEEQVKALKASGDPEAKSKITALKRELEDFIVEMRREIRSARHDNSKCNEDYKKQIKTAAVQQGISVSDYLMAIIQKTIPERDTRANLIAEVEYINSTLAKMGGTMTAEERQAMKDRRTAIKHELEKGEKEHG